MVLNQLTKYVFISGLSAILAGCGDPSVNILQEDETRLKTGGDLAQYHYLVKEPYSVGLSHEGYIIGIEKSPRASIGNPYIKSYDTCRFREWKIKDHPKESKAHTEARNDQFDRINDDDKSMFVSHILSYDLDISRGARFKVSPLYCGYENSGFAKTKKKIEQAKEKPEQEVDRCVSEGSLQAGGDQDVPTSYYEKGWAALDKLSGDIRAKLLQAKDERYTRIIVAAMGWNNNQVETVRRYNALMGNIVAQAKKADAKTFKPLIIGLTWPSVWGGESYFNILNSLYHVVSYPNKTADSDEIGYTIANILINKILQELKSEYDLKIVLIGHSLGARMMSRAMFSAHLINDTSKETNDPPKTAADLFIGLQGAFSVRRFKDDFQLPFPMSFFKKGEGSPYLLKSGNPGQVVLTWADDDKANPIARWITGAAHAGAKAGYKESKIIGDKFYQLKWDVPIDGQCETPRKRMNGKDLTNIGINRVLMVDADEIVNDHNDILDPEMGRLIWESISIFTMGSLGCRSGFVDMER